MTEDYNSRWDRCPNWQEERVNWTALVATVLVYGAVAAVCVLLAIIAALGVGAARFKLAAG